MSGGSLLRVPVGTLKISEKARRYVKEILDNERLSYGPYTRRFESLFAELHACKTAVFCNSGTSALHIALQALKILHDWKDGDEVLVPAVTFVATPNVVVHNKMTPVFVDVDRRTYNIDPALIEAKITPRTRAIMPVHLMGLPCDMAPIQEICRRRGLKIIEDSCETMFARYQGKPVGSLGDIGCFSTYIAHYIVSGVGGFATSNDPELSVLLRSLMNHGRDPKYLAIDDDDGLGGDELSAVVAKRFAFLHHGHSFRATELEAGIGLAQLEDKDSIIKARTDVAAGYFSRLGHLADRLQLPHVPSDREHLYMLFPLACLKEGKDRLINCLESAGVETRDLLPLVTQPIYAAAFKNAAKDYPVAAWLAQRAFYIGCHQDVTPEQQDHVARLITGQLR
jgi:dTDP-4-amino-4,6-dideoxygalactose transaminase